MFENKLKSEKVEMVKRIIRRNNYNQYEKTHAQCIELGLLVNRPALDRFADKLQLIDKAEINRRQSEIRKLEKAQRQAELNRQHAISARHHQQDQEVPLIQPRMAEREPVQHRKTTENPLLAPTQSRNSPPSRRNPSKTHKDMTYEEVKKRETEITFELGEIRIRESELLQELITLSEMLEEKQFN